MKNMSEKTLGVFQNIRLKKILECEVSAGFSLIDVLVAVTILVVGISSLVALSTLVVRNQRLSLERTEANTYAQETIEWARIMRQRLSWDAFIAELIADGSSGRYCLEGALPVEIEDFGLLEEGACQDQQTITIDSVFSRELVFSYDSGQQALTLTSIVRWPRSAGQETSVEVSAIFRKWSSE